MSSSTPTPSAPIVPTDEQIQSHLTHLLATRAPLSPLYNLLIAGAGARITAATRGSFTARLTLGPAHLNSSGALHGAASAALVDWAGGMAIATWDLRQTTGVSLDIHVRYLSAAAREGDVVEVRGTAERVGGAVAFTGVGIWKLKGVAEGGEEEWELVASGTHTKYVRQR
ncbi:thioesterase family protein [Camillea tinctor]|nr:thioesterase family protein [Camillea tinctor]